MGSIPLSLYIDIKNDINDNIVRELILKSDLESTRSPIILFKHYDIDEELDIIANKTANSKKGIFSSDLITDHIASYLRTQKENKKMNEAMEERKQENIRQGKLGKYTPEEIMKHRNILAQNKVTQSNNKRKRDNEENILKNKYKEIVLRKKVISKSVRNEERLKEIMDHIDREHPIMDTKTIDLYQSNIDGGECVKENPGNPGNPGNNLEISLIDNISKLFIYLYNVDTTSCGCCEGF